jgi:catechol 2,3-dioxygenase-like lactoylglutathione lyase family enzyme
MVPVADARRRERDLVAIAPFFFVADIAKSVAYYCDVLGFKHERMWGEPPNFCMPYRDDIVIMLLQVDDKSRIRPNGNDGESWDTHIWVRDADLLFQEFKKKGALIAYEPLNRDLYGNREFAVRDPDGYVIAFGHNIEEKKKAEQKTDR